MFNKIRNRQKTVLSIDKNIELFQEATFVNYNDYGDLVTDGSLYLGGYSNLPFGLTRNLYFGFKGYIKSPKIDERPIKLRSDDLNISSE